MIVRKHYRQLQYLVYTHPYPILLQFFYEIDIIILQVEVQIQSV